MWSTLKNVLTDFNCIDHYVVTALENSPSDKILLALDWLYKEIETMMHDLNYTLVLVCVAF